MSKAGKKLIAAAKEAVAIAKGEAPAARITIAGHHHVPEGTIKPAYGISAAIDVVVRWLQDGYIVEGCRSERIMGCASCEAVALEQQLIALGQEIMEAPRQLHGLTPATPDASKDSPSAPSDA